MKPLLKYRLIYLSLTIISFLICIFIVKWFSHQPFIRGFIGDVVVMALIYFFIKTFYHFQPIKLTISVLILAYTIEILQSTQLLVILGLEHNRLAKLVLGSVFDVFDLIAYTLGAVLVYIFDSRLESRLKCKP